jgi:hypothetical protein
MIVAATDKGFLEKVLIPPEGSYEASIDFDYASGTPSQEFLDVTRTRKNAISSSISSYSSRYQAMDASVPQSTWERFQVPWTIEGDRILSADGRVVFQKPYGDFKFREFEQLQQDVVDIVNASQKKPLEEEKDEFSQSEREKALRRVRNGEQRGPVVDEPVPF